MTSESIQFNFIENRVVQNSNIECNINFYILYDTDGSGQQNDRFYPLITRAKYCIVRSPINTAPYYAEVFFKESQDLFLTTDLNVYHQNSQMMKKQRLPSKSSINSSHTVPSVTWLSNSISFG